MTERWIKILGITTSFLVTLVSGWMFDTNDKSIVFIRIFTVLAGGIIQWETAHYIIKVARKKYPALSQVRKRVIFTGISFIAFNIILSFLGDYFLDHLIDKNPLVVDGARVVTIIVSSVFFAVTTIGLFEAVYFYSNYNKAEMEKEELKRINLQTQFDSLKEQVNPHFLFNSLNSLSSLISTDAQKAEQFVEELSGVYRYLLTTNARKLNTLKEEIRFIQSYVFLLTTRFGDNLNVSIETAHGFESYLLPPLTLQLLVENAVKHNLVSREAPLYIRIFTTENGFLHVTNNLQKKRKGIISGKVGLSNIISKYQLLHQPDLEIKETEKEFIVILPLIKVEAYESIHHRR